MKRAKTPRPATLITWLAAVAIAGGLVKLALDDEIAQVAVPEPAPPSAASPDELPRFEAALSRRAAAPEAE